MKKEWKKPRLVVVQRGSVEESVLIVCKRSDSGTSANVYHSSCVGNVEEGCFNACAMIGES